MQSNPGIVAIVGVVGTISSIVLAVLFYKLSRPRRLPAHFAPNYSGEFEEPVVLPARFPNLLVNGSQGIAVGMATNIPPHNLGEVIDATIHLIDHPDATADDLMRS